MIGSGCPPNRRIAAAPVAWYTLAPRWPLDPEALEALGLFVSWIADRQRKLKVAIGKGLLQVGWDPCDSRKPLGRQLGMRARAMALKVVTTAPLYEDAGMDDHAIRAVRRLTPYD